MDHETYKRRCQVREKQLSERLKAPRKKYLNIKQVYKELFPFVEFERSGPRFEQAKKVFYA